MKRKLFIMLATLMAVASKSDAQININVNLPRIVKFVDVVLIPDGKPLVL